MSAKKDNKPKASPKTAEAKKKETQKVDTKTVEEVAPKAVADTQAAEPAKRGRKPSGPRKSKEEREAEALERARARGEARLAKIAAKKAEKEAQAAKSKADREAAKKEIAEKRAAEKEALKVKRAEEAAKRAEELKARKEAVTPAEGRRRVKATHVVYKGDGLTSPQKLSSRGQVLDYLKTHHQAGDTIDIESLDKNVSERLYGIPLRGVLIRLEETGHVDLITKENQ